MSPNDSKDRQAHSASNGPSPREYETFFDQVAEINRHLKYDDGNDLAATRRILEEVVAALPNGRSPDQPCSLADIIASSSLSGGDHPCRWVDCRVKSARSGARFAALYAERIWIRDPFAHLFHDEVDDFEYVFDAIAAIASFLEWKPLLVSGIAGHLAPVCTRCATKRIGDNDLLRASVSDFGLELLDELVQAGTATARREKGEISVELSLPRRYTGHKESINRLHGAEAKRVARFLGKKQSRRIPRRGRIALDAYYGVWRPTLDEALMQAMYRGLSRGAYVSDLPIDLEIASRNDGDGTAVQQASRVLGVLKHSVPVVESVPLETVLRLRQEDDGSFQLYRNRIAALRGEIDDEKKLRDAAEALKAEFATLETMIRSRRKSLWGGIRDQVKVATGTVGAGLGLWLSHVLTPTWSAIAAAAGGLTVAQKVAADALSARRRAPDEMRHPLYFLWRVTKSGKRTL